MTVSTYRVEYEMGGEQFYELVFDAKQAMQLAMRLRAKRMTSNWRRPLYRNVRLIWPDPQQKEHTP